jgi:hypothetical protein
MFRVAPRWLSLRHLMIPLMIAVAITLGIQISKLDGTHLGRAPDRFEAMTASTAAAEVPGVASTGSTQATTVGRSPAAIDESTLVPAKSVARSATREFRAVSPRTRAEVPPPFWNGSAGYGPAEKSYTGAGRAFDAVH